MNERIWNQRMLGLTFNVEDGRITIFRSTLEALGWPTHYRFLYNREAKQVVVQNCTAEDAGAHKTPNWTMRRNKSNSFKWNCGGSKLSLLMLRSPQTFRLRWTAF